MRRFATAIVCRVAALSGGAKHDLAGGTAGADCTGAGIGNSVVTLTGSAGWFVVVMFRLSDICRQLAGLSSRVVVSGYIVGAGRRTEVVDVVRREFAT